MKPRYDIYRNIHKALRRELGQLVADTGSADGNSRSEIAEIVARWNVMRRLLDGHHKHEDVFLGPHLKTLAPALFEEMERDHHASDVDLDGLSAAAATLVDATDRPRAAHAFYLDLARFVGTYTVHIDREERLYMPALQAEYTDAELAAIDGAIIANIQPDLLAMYFARMIPAMTPTERTDLLSEVRANAPAAVFEGLCGVAKSSLSTAAWSALHARLFGANGATDAAAMRA